MKLVLPPLRERKEDIPLLVDHFIRKFNRLSGKEIRGLSPEVLPVLMAHEYPGNIRELENIIEYATVVCKNNMIGIEHLPDYLHPRIVGMKRRVRDDNDKEISSWDEMEQRYIFEALRKNHWNRAATAAQLGIHPTTLWRKIKHLNVEIPKQDGRTRRS